MAVRLCLVTATAMALGASLGAAEFDGWTETRDWYISLGVAQVPEVSEKTSGSNGSETYEWENLAGDFAPRLALGYMACAGDALGGWTIGIEGVVTTCDVTPDTYQVDGLTFSNPSNRSLRYHTAGMLVSGGYQFGINADADAMSPFLIIAPFLGLGAAFADSEVRDQNGVYASNSGVGWYAEGGLRTGVIFTEKHWLGGVLVDLSYSSGEVTVDFANGSTSSLVHERMGITASLMMGYRL
jgi:hypothetical protein